MSEHTLMRRCTNCSETKPLDGFAINRLGRHGRQAECKACLSAKARTKYGLNRGAEIAKSSRWNRLNAVKVAANMRKCRERNPEHFRDYARGWRERNPDKVREGDRAKHRNRRAAAGKVTAEEWREILAAAAGRCAYCARERPLTMDHIIPLCRGGTHDVGNIAAVCLPCNASKGAKDLDVWFFERLWRDGIRTYEEVSAPSN